MICYIIKFKYAKKVCNHISQCYLDSVLHLDGFQCMLLIFFATILSLLRFFRFFISFSWRCSLISVSPPNSARKSQESDISKFHLLENTFVELGGSLRSQLYFPQKMYHCHQLSVADRNHCFTMMVINHVIFSKFSNFTRMSSYYFY